MINVTKTYLPPQEEYLAYLDQIWKSEWITNHGKCAVELENRLREYLNVRHLFIVNNGTIALQIAIKALDLKGEIITTPFSYVATTSTIVWENCTPVFADIHPETFCIDTDQVEKKITKNTCAIMATHVYGNPCDVDRLEQLAKKHGIKIIYDAAHAFGVSLHNKNILQWGDISTLSFHATKVFHTVEGGAITTEDDELAHRISYMRNFGHNGPEEFWGLGINGKISEFHAAMGLVNLKHIEMILESRKEISKIYTAALRGIGAIMPKQPAGLNYNYAYYPVIFRSSEVMSRVKEKLNSEEIFPRRYFYPSLNLLPYVKGDAMPVSDDISQRVLCLPLYVGLKKEDVERICEMIRTVAK